MPALQLTFPVRVHTTLRHGVPHYMVSPLLMAGPEGVGRTLGQAVQGCLEMVRKEFAAFRPTRTTVNTLLWYGFNPSLTVHHSPWRSASAVGHDTPTFTAVWFDLHDNRYVCLPAFNHQFFVARKDAEGGYRMEQEVRRMVRSALARRGTPGQAPPFAYYMTGKDEFVTTATVTLSIPNAPFSFEKDHDPWDGLGSRTQDTKGSVEIRKVAYDLNSAYPDDLLRAYDYEDHLPYLQQVLFEDSPIPTVLVGSAGVGKTTVIHECLRRFIAGQTTRTPDQLPKVWHLDPNKVIAGMNIVGSWERRFAHILDYACTRLQEEQGVAGPDLLYIDNPVALLRIGKTNQSSLVLGDVLKPYIEKRSLRLLLEATPEVWQQMEEMDRRFTDLFHVILLPEPDREKALPILLQRRADLEHVHRCEFTTEALVSLFDLQQTYHSHQALPGRVVSFMQQLSTRYAGHTIDTEQVHTAFLEATQLNQRIFDPAVTLAPGEVEAFIEAHLIGQVAAQQCMTNVIHLIKARLNDPERPMASLLFMGPTGVGKTEAAKVLARYLFDEEQGLMRFDMNAYADGYAVARLLGDAAQPDGHLTGRIRHQPFGVVLLDEIEKAHPSVHDLLLQVLDEGRLTDSLGRTVDFSHVVIIMTSNLGAVADQRAIGFVRNAATQMATYHKAVTDFFRPEFVNRIDHLVPFYALTLEEIKKVARLQVDRFLQREGFARRTIIFTLTEAALHWLAEKGYVPTMGGRALKRTLEHTLTTLAADHLVTLPPATPALLEVDVVATQLNPRITPLVFAAAITDPLATLFSEATPRDAFYEALYEVLEEIQAVHTPPTETLSWSDETTGQVNTEQWLFQDRLRVVEKRLKRWLEQAQKPTYRPPLFSHRMRRFRRLPYGKIRHVDPGNLFGQLDMRMYLETQYQEAQEAFHPANARALRAFVDVAALDLQCDEVLAAAPVTTALYVRPVVQGNEHAEVTGLIAHYAALLHRIDPAFEGFTMHPAADGADTVHLCTTTLPGAYALLQHEAGLHLFIASFGAAQPVEVQVAQLKKGQTALDFAAHCDSLPRLGTVLRLYVLPQDTDTGTITDLRTGLAHPYPADPDSWFYWLYSLLPEVDRLDLA